MFEIKRKKEMYNAARHEIHEFQHKPPYLHVQESTNGIEKQSSKENYYRSTLSYGIVDENLFVRRASNKDRMLKTISKSVLKRVLPT